MKNEMMVFEGREVEVFEFNGKVLFNPRHVAECLDLSESALRSAVSEMSEKQVVKLTNSDVGLTEFRKLNNAGENFLTESGVGVLITRARNVSISAKNSIIEAFTSQGYNISLISVSRKEIEFIELLENVLEPFGYECIRQHTINKKRIDLYIKDLNIAIEYDENNHKNYSEENEKERQKIIQLELGCAFIRVSDKESNAYNVGLVIKNIFKL